MTFHEFGHAVEGYLESKESHAEQTRLLAWYIMRGYVDKSSALKYDSPEKLYELPSDEKKRKVREEKRRKRMDELPMATIKWGKDRGGKDKRS